MTTYSLVYSFPNFEPVNCSMSSSNCCFLIWIQFSQGTGKMSGTPISLRIFQFVVIHTVKGFTIINEAEEDVSLELPCLLCDPMNVGNLISGSFAFSKFSLNIWKFSVHILLKLSLKNFEYYFSLCCECNCVVVWTFFGIAIHWDWNESWHFPVL